MNEQSPEVLQVYLEFVLGGIKFHTLVVLPVGKVLDVYHISRGTVRLQWKSVEMFYMHTEHKASRLQSCCEVT